MSVYDTIVIGAGLTGLTAACRLAQAGQKVLLTALGEGALLLAPGCIDVLGFQPADSQQPVKDPLAQLDSFLSDNPDHPYRLLGKETLAAGLTAFQELVNRHGLNFQGDPHHNWHLPTTIGAVHPTCLAPASMAGGDLQKAAKVLIVGFRELRDFYPTLIADNLNSQSLGVQASALQLDAPPPVAGRVNITPIQLAHAFEDPLFRRRLVQAVAPHSKGVDKIGFPAVLGLAEHAGVLSDLQKGLGKPVFEINTLPPSVPGRRLFEALRDAFLKAGGRLIIGGKILAGRIENGRVVEIRLETASRAKPLRAENIILATGGIFGGGLQTDASGRVWEPIFGLPLHAEDNRHRWFTRSFFASTGQPVANYGVMVNARFNPVDEAGQPVAENLFAAGAVLAHSEWTRGRTGDGLAVTTAYAIAEQLTRSAQ